ncbi:MAG: VTT domain-containing protein [Planctomycetes bacterium]|nr:VTT domain-containing protein [Planctomycetota bacterium]
MDDANDGTRHEMENASPAVPGPRPWWRRVPRTVWLLLAVMLVIIVPFLCFEDAINDWFAAAVKAAEARRWELACLFFMALAVDIFMPVPSSLVSTLCGMTLGLNLGFWVSFMGMNASCAVGYLFGRHCSGAAGKLIGPQEMAALKRWEGRAGGPFLVAMRAVPVLAEASVLFAGVARTPPLRSALWMLSGNAVVSLAYAIAGSLGHDSGAMYPALLASLTATGLIMLIGRVAFRREG